MNENVRTFGPENCVVCGLSFTDSVEEKVTVRAKGLATLIHYSFLHKDGDLMNYLESEPEKVVVHIRCRNKYTKPRADVDRACDDSVQNPAKRLRSSTEVFSFKTDCFLCGEFAVLDSRHPERNKQIHIAQTLGLRESILTKCDERLDTWALEVKGRLQQCSDLPAADALYHGSCYTRFYQGQKPPNTGEPLSIRQDHDDKYHTFLEMCDWFENCDELCSLVDLRQHMLDRTSDESKVYSVQSLKRKLIERYGDHIFLVNTRVGGTLCV